MTSSVNVSVEAPLESNIQEIHYDGSEVYQDSLSMPENLTRLTSKIDFSKVGSEDSSDVKVLEKDSEGETTPGAAFQSQVWQWEGVRTRLRNALQEVCVLHDVLQVCKERYHYLVLDPVSQEPPEPKPYVSMLAKKKALAGASTILSAGAERLRANRNETSRYSGLSTDYFYNELLRMRQNWRLKKLGNTILGDLSYKSAGSRFYQSGIFEVKKSEDQGMESCMSPPPSPSAGPSSGHSTLEVTIPSELDDVICYIQVRIQQDQQILACADITRSSSNLCTTPKHSWQNKLESAQNLLFCRELFSQLAKEAVSLQAPVPHIVIGNQISASLFPTPSVQLTIGLCHTTSGEKKAGGGSGSAHAALTCPDHSQVLEHSVHQLLWEVHHKNMHHPTPHPTSAMLGWSKRRRLAGPQSADRYQLVEMVKSETLLEQIIAQAQHVVLRLRTMLVIDSLATKLAREMKDPLIVTHWNTLSSPTHSCVKMNLTSHGYETLCRTSLVLHIAEKSIKVICRDGRVLHVSYEPQELSDLILCQITAHQIAAVQALAKYMGWLVIGGSNHLGVGEVESIGNAAACLLASPAGDRLISVKCWPQSPPQVLVQMSPNQDFFIGTGGIVRDSKWEHLGGSFKEVKLENMEGRNFLNKMEFLMAALQEVSVATVKPKRGDRVFNIISTTQ